MTQFPYFKQFPGFADTLCLALVGCLSLAGCLDDGTAVDAPDASVSADSATDAASLAAGDGAAADAAAGDTAAEATAAVVCPPGIAGCFGGARYVCNADGSALTPSPCAVGQTCLDGACVQCLNAAGCPDGQACIAGTCTVAPLAIDAAGLPPALVGVAYTAALKAKGGVSPYAWAVTQGTLPAGILLDAAGSLGGSATTAGTASFEVKVTDAKGETATAIRTLVVQDAGLVITTTSPLKAAMDGEPYSVKFAAQGGKAPYFWGITAGKLPTGLALGADGMLGGAPVGDGSYTFDLKVLDNGSPTLAATRSFALDVKLAPLEIIGTQQVDLFITKVIVLPLILIVDKVPVPYSAKLEAKGGKKPYKWTETPLPGLVKTFLPKSGIPLGLKLAADGTISGSVTDTTLPFELKLPLGGLTLKGFFFAAEVTDSQAKAATKTALFIIPTVPIGGP